MAPLIHPLLLLVHLLGVVAWVGGMGFAHFALRPAAAEVLAPPQRIPLLVATFQRFFGFTAVAVAAVLLSGAVMLVQAGAATAPLAWHLMAGLGLVMALIFAVIRLRLFPVLREQAAGQHWPAAAQALAGIRRLVAVNLVLGVLCIAAGVASRG